MLATVFKKHQLCMPDYLGKGTVTYKGYASRHFFIGKLHDAYSIYRVSAGADERDGTGTDGTDGNCIFLSRRRQLGTAKQIVEALEAKFNWDAESAKDLARINGLGGSDFYAAINHLIARF